MRWTRLPLVALALTSALLVVAGPAAAQEDLYVGPPEVAPATTVLVPAGPPPEVQAQVLPQVVTPGPQAEAAELAFTGGDVLGLTLLGLTAVGFGVLMLTRRRRPATVPV